MMPDQCPVCGGNQTGPVSDEVAELCRVVQQSCRVCGKLTWWEKDTAWLHRCRTVGEIHKLKPRATGMSFYDPAPLKSLHDHIDAYAKHRETVE